ncbi:MAG: hypothetical protein ABII00_00570 [Elusimicrobiota bacterium]
MLFNCQKYSTGASRGEFEEASGWTRFINRVHLAVCRHCALFTRQMRMLGDAVRRLAGVSVDEAKLAPFKERLVARLTEDDPRR